MFRNNYDNDSITFSPQGRIFQVEYAGEAVKQGSVIVGAVNGTHAVLVALKRNAEELSSYQKKIIEIGPHCGVGLAGLTADARVLSRFMQQETRREHLIFNRKILISRLTRLIADRAQSNTQHYGRRPYGVGLLIAGYDRLGPHLFDFQPSGVVQEMLACAIGARSQMARTYLERYLGEISKSTRTQLICHTLRALRESLGQEKQLTIDNTSISVVGKGENFTLLEGQAVKEWLDMVGIGETGSGESTTVQDTEATTTTTPNDSVDAMDIDNS